MTAANAAEFGDGHKAAVDPDQHDKRHRHRRRGAPGQAQAQGERERRLGGEILAPGVVQHPQKERPRLQQAGQDAGEKQPRHRLLGDDAIEDQRQRGRDNDADRARGAEDAEREPARIAAGEHRRQQDRPHCQRGRNRGAGDRREERARDHSNETERTLDAAEPGGGEVDQRLRHPAPAHKSRRHDEQRQRHQGA